MSVVGHANPAGRTGGAELGEDVVEGMELAGGAHELLGVARLVRRLLPRQEQVRVVACLAQVHRRVAQAACRPAVYRHPPL